MNKSILPSEFVEKIKDLYPEAETHNMLLESLKSKATTFRVNTLQADPEKVIKSLESKGFELKQSQFSEIAYELITKDKKTLIQTSEYQNGEIYLQSFASQIPVLVLDPKAEEKILDLTAAPGSKTSQISAITKQSSELHANDVNTIRLQKLKHNLQKLGVNKNITIHNRHGSDLVNDLSKDYFDKILVDAPCSGEATFNIDYPKSYSYWSKDRVSKFHERQTELLEAALGMLKPEGSLVYSTCTFDVLENEKVIQSILQKFPDQVEVESISIPNIETLETLPEFKGTDIEKTIRLKPNHNTESFFIAKLKKCTK